MLVVAFHFVLRAGIASGSLFSQGYLGVNFFFLLSGFILVYTYVDPVGRMRLTPYDFWVARLARIYPVYLLGFVVAAGPYLFQHHSAGASIVTALADIALTQAWIPTPAGTAWNGPGWSLSAEAFFYLAFPFTVLYIARFTRRQAFVALGASWFIIAGIRPHPWPAGHRSRGNRLGWGVGTCPVIQSTGSITGIRHGHGTRPALYPDTVGQADEGQGCG